MPGELIQSLSETLKERLLQPLPGSSVQKMMSAYPKDSSRIHFNFEDEPRESAVLIMLFERDGEILFPLIQRPPYTGIHSGQIGLPGGKMEEEDRDRVDTALRETEEEIGVDAGDIRVLGKLTELYVQASHYNVIPVVGYLPYIPEYNPDPVEVSRVIDGNINSLLDENNKKIRELLVRDKYRIMAPYFDIADEVVWGATAMILNEFSTILKEIINEYGTTDKK